MPDDIAADVVSIALNDSEIIPYSKRPDFRIGRIYNSWLGRFVNGTEIQFCYQTVNLESNTSTVQTFVDLRARKVAYKANYFIKPLPTKTDPNNGLPIGANYVNAIDINKEPAIKEIIASSPQWEKLSEEQFANATFMEIYLDTHESPCTQIISIMQQKNYSITQTGATLNKYGYVWVPGEGHPACWRGRSLTEDELKKIQKEGGPGFHPFGYSNSS